MSSLFFTLCHSDMPSVPSPLNVTTIIPYPEPVLLVGERVCGAQVAFVGQADLKVKGVKCLAKGQAGWQGPELVTPDGNAGHKGCSKEFPTEDCVGQIERYSDSKIGSNPQKKYPKMVGND